MNYQPDNRDRKIQGRQKRQKYVQGKTSYLQSLINAIKNRSEKKRPSKK